MLTVDHVLDGLDPAQREAATAVTGPVRIIAGAGTGKTRTVTRRIAAQVAAGAVRPDQVMAVTFTERAAAELRTRLAALGVAPVRAATFHGAAWAQVRYFSDRVPQVLASTVRVVGEAAARTTGLRGVDWVDLAGEIEWAKARLVPPDAYASAAAQRDTPADPERIAAAYANYEELKADRGLVDYGDMLLHAIELLADEQVAALVRDRYRAFTVDEFQDVNPAQWALLRAWLGQSAEVCVVGDPDQTIYTFNGASASYLEDFPRHFPGARTIVLAANHRSTGRILAAANALRGLQDSHPRALRAASQPQGGEVVWAEHADADAEVRGCADGVRLLLDAGVPPEEIAVLTRTNAQAAPFEQALRAAGVPVRVRGPGAFLQRPAVRQALQALMRQAADPPPRPGPPPPEGTVGLPEPARRVAERILATAVGWRPRPPRGQRERERWDDVTQLLDVIDRAAAAGGAGLAAVVADLATQAQPEDQGAAVTIASIHRAKGLEFDAVFVVGVEEGLLPIAHAKDDGAIAEERRLLYVALTRARRHLVVSWALSRRNSRGVERPRRPSRFLRGLAPGLDAGAGAPRSHAARGRRSAGRGGPPPRADGPAAAALRSWRSERARADGVPAYVVFPDATLHAVVDAAPASLEALRAVSGFGPKRVAAYGQEVLRVLRAGSGG